MTAPTPAHHFGSLLLRVSLILGAVLWVYAPILHGTWLWDDDFYITKNSLAGDPSRLLKTWFEPGSLDNYFPITYTFQWVEYALWGNNTLGCHLVCIVLHVFDSLLVWRLLAQFGLRLAWLGGLLFALHPTAVESVAWCTELKNTLSLFPFLMTMSTWVAYRENPTRGRYYLTLSWFLLALLCKTTGIMFPVLILLHVWWLRGRVGWSDLLASAPFFAISLVFGFLTIFSEKHFFAVRHMPGLAPLPFPANVACAGLITAFYFWNCLWPVGLLPLYPRWTMTHPSALQFLPWVMIALVLFWLWWHRRGFGRHLLLGLGYFLINLLPFMGFSTSTYMIHTWTMDHFLYVPIIGLIGLTVAAIGVVEDRLPAFSRYPATVFVAVLISAMAWESRAYAPVFSSENALQGFIQDQYGKILFQGGREADAISHFQTALRLNPHDPVAQVGLEQAEQARP